MPCISAAYAVVRCICVWLGVCHVRVLCGNGYRITDTGIIAIECEEETVPKLSNGTIFN